MRYGICPNSEHRCPFSYRSSQLAQLHDQLQLIQARESQGKPVGALNSDFEWCTRYFQSGIACRGCGELLFVAILSTAGMDSESAEYQRRIRLNHLLALTGELQARGILDG